MVRYSLVVVMYTFCFTISRYRKHTSLMKLKLCLINIRNEKWRNLVVFLDSAKSMYPVDGLLVELEPQKK